MAMTMADRQAIREAFATALAAAIPDYQEVIGHTVQDFGGKTPVATVLSAGSDRPPMTMEGGRTTFFLSLNNWVLYSSEEDSWTEQDAEDKMDDLERQVAEFVHSNRRTTSWDYLAYDSRSIIRTIPIGGDMYLHEQFSIRVEVFG